MECLASTARCGGINYPHPNSLPEGEGRMVSLRDVIVMIGGKA